MLHVALGGAVPEQHEGVDVLVKGGLLGRRREHAGRHEGLDLGRDGFDQAGLLEHSAPSVGFQVGLVPHVAVERTFPTFLLRAALDHLEVFGGPRDESGVFGLRPLVEFGVSADFRDGEGTVVLHGGHRHFVIGRRIRTRRLGQAHRTIGLQDGRDDLAEHQAPGVHALEGGAVAGEEADGVELAVFRDGVEGRRSEPRPEIDLGVVVKGGPVVAPGTEEAFERGFFRQGKVPHVDRQRQGDFLAATLLDGESSLVFARGGRGTGLHGEPDALQTAFLDLERRVGHQRVGPVAGDFVTGELRRAGNIDFLDQPQFDVRRRNDRTLRSGEIPG